jgi:AbrB family looped-hinge helix DNA binding protein
VVIPKPVRDAMGIRPGDEVWFRIEGGKVIVEAKSPQQWLEEFLDAVPKAKKKRIRGPVDLHPILDEQYEERLGRGR